MIDEARDVEEMERRYPVGQKVKCIKGYDLSSYVGLVANEVYTIREVGQYGLFVEESCPEGWWPWHYWGDLWPPISWTSDDLWNLPMEAR